jgi:hypothetical protein
VNYPTHCSACGESLTDHTTAKCINTLVAKLDELVRIGNERELEYAKTVEHDNALLTDLSSRLDRCMKVMRAVKQDLLDRARVDGEEHVVDLSNRCWQWLCNEIDGTQLPGSVQNYWIDSDNPPDYHDGNATKCGRCHEAVGIGHVCVVEKHEHEWIEVTTMQDAADSGGDLHRYVCRCGDMRVTGVVTLSPEAVAIINPESE